MFSRSTFLFSFTATVLHLIKSELYRLPKDIKPIRYFVTMEPLLIDTDMMWEPMPYNGSVVIQLIVLKSTKNVTIHQVGLNIDKSSISIVDSTRELKIAGTSTNDGDKTYTVQLEEELLKDKSYNFTIGNFTGLLGNGEGFFKAFHWSNNTPRVLAATHFEPTGARRAFPCFDEPSLKARFIISLIRNAKYNSVSNGKLDTTEYLGDGRFKDTFKETPLMPSYTLAFAVSDYKHTKKVERHRILAKPKAIDNGELKFSLEQSAKTLKVLEEYTGIDFVIDKMDMIAIPDSFFHEHAMENWGLVVFGESYLIHTNKSVAEDYKRTTCYIAHEFAHQWFGNLVTPIWWDYLWLSESFAAYFQFHIAAIVEPTWRLTDQFLLDVVHVAHEKEERSGAHPLNYKIERSGAYPPFHILYEKGGSIVRMFAHFLTEDIFRKGLQNYLHTNKFGNAHPSDLYAALQKAVDEASSNHLLGNFTVAYILRTWDSQKGFPIVTVKRNYETGSVTLEQNSPFDDDDATKSKWIIPINYAFSLDENLNFSQTTADYWLTETTATLDEKFPVCGWLIVNKQETGYYRVNYDLENWDRIILFLNSDNFTLIHPLNRAQLIEDAFNLAHRQEIPWEIPLRLGEYITREKDYIPLVAFYNALGKYISILNLDSSTDPKNFQVFGNYTFSSVVTHDKPTEDAVYREYIKRTLANVKETLGFKSKPTDTHLDQLQRTKFLLFYNYFNDQNIL